MISSWYQVFHKCPRDGQPSSTRSQTEKKKRVILLTSKRRPYLQKTARCLHVFLLPQRSGRSRRRSAWTTRNRPGLAPSRFRPRPRPVAGAATSKSRKNRVGFTGAPSRSPEHRRLRQNPLFAPISLRKGSVNSLHFSYQK